MKVAILADDRPTYVRPLAEGLFRMLKACGADPVLHYDALAHLGLRRSIDRNSLRSLAASDDGTIHSGLHKSHVGVGA